MHQTSKSLVPMGWKKEHLTAEEMTIVKRFLDSRSIPLQNGLRKASEMARLQPTPHTLNQKAYFRDALRGLRYLESTIGQKLWIQPKG